MYVCVCVYTCACVRVYKPYAVAVGMGDVVNDQKLKLSRRVYNFIRYTDLQTLFIDGFLHYT